MKRNVKNFLKENPGMWDVENIRRRCSIGHWSVALTHCLELLQNKEIRGRKTSHGWVFWIGDEE